MYAVKSNAHYKTSRSDLPETFSHTTSNEGWVNTQLVDQQKEKFNFFARRGACFTNLSQDERGEEGSLLIDWLQRGATVNAERYCNVLLRLKQTIKNKRKGKRSNGIVLLQDNA
ncbi:hypothetical protein AVEN_126624-1 [Araneus ventricosus]|uniref:Uncharacterized protein n=1 Tax=Araneus ventricosus TaxID=182803 RepID=A0A4Y2SYH7_ARAVE|nr:hypothetical protein AVEN_126624-1 [Araneus ventricosus]